MEINDLHQLISGTVQLRRELEAAFQQHPEALPVLWPFHSAYRADTGTEPTTEQKVLIPWRKEFGVTE